MLGIQEYQFDENLKRQRTDAELMTRFGKRGGTDNSIYWQFWHALDKAADLLVNAEGEVSVELFAVGKLPRIRRRRQKRKKKEKEIL